MAAGRSLMDMARAPVKITASADVDKEAVFAAIREKRAAAKKQMDEVAAAKKKQEEEAAAVAKEMEEAAELYAAEYEEAVVDDIRSKMLFIGNSDVDALLKDIRVEMFFNLEDPSRDPRTKWPATWGNPKFKIPIWLTMLALHGVCVHHNRHTGCTWSKCKFEHACVVCESDKHGALWIDDDLDDGGDGKQWKYACDQVQLLADHGFDVRDKTSITDFIVDMQSKLQRQEMRSMEG